MGEILNSAYTRDEPAKAVAKRLGLKRGERVETRSFEPGYRGSWFACEIKVVDSGLRNHVRYKLEYAHFPDEGMHWCQAYQQRHRGKHSSYELMVRPVPPPVMSKKEACQATFSGPVVIRKRWQIGDLVDWRKKNVWWEATIVGFLSGGRVKVSLFAPPIGEGGTYITDGEQLRPSLTWVSVENWAVARSKINGRVAGEVVQLPCSGLTQDSGSDLTGEDTLKDMEVTQGKRSDVKAISYVRKTRKVVRKTEKDVEEASILNGVRGDISGGAFCRSAAKLGQYANNDNTWVHTRSNESEAKFDVVDDGDGDLDTPLIPPLKVLGSRSSKDADKKTKEADKKFKDADKKFKDSDKKIKEEEVDIPDNTHSQHPNGSGISVAVGEVDEPDYDSEYVEDVLYIKRLLFWKRNRKFKRYRKQVNRAIQLVKRMKAKHLLESFKLGDSDSWSEEDSDR